MDWIKEGLHFTCNQCGNCCTGEPGYIWCTPKELENIASFLNLDFDTFTKNHVRRVHNHYSLIESPEGACIFWSKKKGCEIYDVRPSQCRTWPFWSEVVESESTWKEEGRSCQGIQHGLRGKGSFHPKEKIIKEVAISRDNDPLA